MRVPFVNLGKYHRTIKKNVLKDVGLIIDDNGFILGKATDEFEKEFAAFCQVKYGVGLDNGSSALELGLRALGIGVGDEVITPVNSFIASSSSIATIGAKPILVDCDPVSYNLDPEKTEKAITKKTKAIMVVHLYGQSSNMVAFKGICRRYKLYLIEDACQAHGATYKNKKVGSFGDLAAFSFYPSKNLGAMGDGGILVTNKKMVADKVKMMRNYGQKEKYNHLFLAWNRRLDNLQAAVLRIKLTDLEKQNCQRRKAADLYSKYLRGTRVVLPVETKNNSHVYHLYVIQAEKRNNLQKFLSQKEIEVGIHYPIPIHLQKAFAYLGYKKGDFPVTERLSRRILSLPIFPGITEREIKYACNSIKDFYEKDEKKPAKN